MLQWQCKQETGLVRWFVRTDDLCVLFVVPILAPLLSHPLCQISQEFSLEAPTCQDCMSAKNPHMSKLSPQVSNHLSFCQCCEMLLLPTSFHPTCPQSCSDKSNTSAVHLWSNCGQQGVSKAGPSQGMCWQEAFGAWAEQLDTVGCFFTQTVQWQPQC